MEIKPVTVVNASLIPGIHFEFCGTVKRYIECLKYWEVDEEAATAEANPDAVNEQMLNATLTHNDDDVIAVVYFGNPFIEALTTTRKYHSLVSKAVARLSHAITVDYFLDFAWAGTICSTDAIADRISDTVNNYVWEYCDSLIAKHKEKKDEGKTPKKRGRKPKADKAVVDEASTSESKQDSAAKVEEKSGETLDSNPVQDQELGEAPKKRGRKPKAQQVEEAPKKHRGRPRKTAEAFEEEEPKSSPDPEEEAATKAESIPFDGSAEIDFGF